VRRGRACVSVRVAIAALTRARTGSASGFLVAWFSSISRCSLYSLHSSLSCARPSVLRMYMQARIALRRAGAGPDVLGPSEPLGSLGPQVCIDKSWS
jgi:hypothetical protein